MATRVSGPARKVRDGSFPATTGPASTGTAAPRPPAGRSHTGPSGSFCAASNADIRVGVPSQP